MKFFCAFLFLIIEMTSPGWAGEKQFAGTVSDFYGGAFATNQEGSRNLMPGTDIYVGDRIFTGEKTRVRIKMADDAEIVIGDHADFQITEYLFDPDSGNGKGILRLLSGFIKAKSGKLLSALGNKKGSFEVHTSTAVIGVRGTEFWAGFFDDGRLGVALFSGKGVDVKNLAGQAELTDIHFGTFVKSVNVAPDPPRLWSKEDIQFALAMVEWKK
jgi:hypothetical protein